MLNKNEIFAILLVTLIIGFVVSFTKSFEMFFYAFFSMFIIVSLNVLAKKISSYYFESEIEIKLWEVKKYGFKPKSYFKKPFPTGAFLPIIIALLSLGYVKWMASLVFDIKPKIYRAAKRHGLYSFSEITELHLGIIAASGILVNLVLAVAGYLAGFDLFSKLNIYYAFFNMIPLSDLDGNKIFFGNIVLWSLLAAITLVGLAFVFFVI
tara:strand:+ start:329 stop:955 length:627 start_codon:yes stop_codon:yes gene_type:complete